MLYTRRRTEPAKRRSASASREKKKGGEEGNRPKRSGKKGIGGIFSLLGGEEKRKNSLHLREEGGEKEKTQKEGGRSRLRTRDGRKIEEKKQVPFISFLREKKEDLLS